jgi:Fic family protein
LSGNLADSTIDKLQSGRQSFNWVELDGQSDAVHVTIKWMESDAKTDELIPLQSMQITPEFLGVIADIDEFKGSWRAVGRVAPDRLTSLRRVATIESIASSTRIEGAKLSNREVEHLLSNLKNSPLSSRDEQDVAGYAEVIEFVSENFESMEFSENIIKQLHRDLLKYSPKDERHRGEYKKIASNIEAFSADGVSLGVVLTTTSPFDTPREMRELVEWVNTSIEKRTLHPLLIVSLFKVVFLKIHPFQDGNGRLSRIIVSWLLLRCGYSYLPFCSLESVVEQRKDGYYRALHETQVTIGTAKPNWNPWLQFFLNVLHEHKRQLEVKIVEELRVIGSLPELSVQIVEWVRTHGRITVSEASKITGVSRNTIKDHLRALVLSEVLVRHGAGRGTWYSLG